MHVLSPSNVEKYFIVIESPSFFIVQLKSNFIYGKFVAIATPRNRPDIAEFA